MEYRPEALAVDSTENLAQLLEWYGLQHQSPGPIVSRVHWSEPGNCTQHLLAGCNLEGTQPFLARMAFAIVLLFLLSRFLTVTQSGDCPFLTPAE